MMAWTRVSPGQYRTAGWRIDRDGRAWLVWECIPRRQPLLWGEYGSLREAQREVDRVEVRA